MKEYLKKVLELVKPYRFRFILGLTCGFFSGLLAFTLPVSLKLAMDTVFPTEQGAGVFSFSSADLQSPTNLLKDLNDKSNPVSVFLSDHFDAVTRAALANYKPATTDTNLQATLTGALDRIIVGPPLYDANRFTGVNLRPETKELLAKNPNGRRLIRLNRMLLEDAYPQDFVPLPPPKPKFAFLPAGIGRALESVADWFSPSGRPARSRTMLAIALIPAAMLIRGLLGYVNVYMLSWVSIRAANDLRARVFAHLMQMPVSFFNQNRTGDLMARVEGAMQVTGTIATSFGIIVREPITVVATIATLFALQPWLTLLTLLVFPVCLLPVIIFGRKLRHSHTGIHETFANATTVLHESFTGFRVIKAYNLEQEVVEQFRRAIKAAMSFYMRSIRASELPSPLIEFIGSIGVAAIFAYFAFASPGHSEGNLLAFFACVFNLYAPLKNLSRLQSQLTLARASVEPAYAVLAQQTTLPEPAQPKPLQARGAPIRFQNVSFSYGDRTVLHDINLEIKPGQFLALVGETGSGKTSLANLLLRFYDPQQGAVLIGNTDIREVSSRDLRANIAVVSQETVLFNDTIRYNIAVGRPGASNAEIEEAARHAYAHDFITQEKTQGYETPVGEKGITVSGGQRQRIAIARAIVRNAPILILDEATNALDANVESIVQAALEELMKGRTIICIAHRLSTIQRADAIVVLDHGRIVETGTHAELVRTGGIYSKLYELSSRGNGTLA